MYIVIEIDLMGIQVCRQDIEEDDLAEAVGTAVEMTKRSPLAVILRQRIGTHGPKMATFWVEFVQMIHAEKVGKANKIIAKLPKCWRLNKECELVQDVPVVPKMELYLSQETTPRLGGIIVVDSARVVVYEITAMIITVRWRGFYARVSVDECYDSREAAEFVLSQANQEKIGEIK